ERVGWACRRGEEEQRQRRKRQERPQWRQPHGERGSDRLPLEGQGKNDAAAAAVAAVESWCESTGEGNAASGRQTKQQQQQKQQEEDQPFPVVAAAVLSVESTLPHPTTRTCHP